MFKLHDHQESAYDAILDMDTDKGRIVIPTGGGKTAIEAFALRDFINEDGRDIHLVLAPRIALVNQLFLEYRKLIGQNFLAVAFHSGRAEPDYTRIKWQELSTTSVDVIRDEQKRAKRMDKDLVVFSTYHSCHKLLKLKFDTLIADESQYCVSENYYDVVSKLDATRKLFFTATEKHSHSANGRGLNNEKTFGPVVYQVTPHELIRKKIIVPPRLHIMEANANDEDFAIIDEVTKVAAKQVELSNEMPVQKILFAMKGTKDVALIAENVKKVKKALPGFKVFTIMSNSKYGAMVDGTKMARGNFFKELRETDHALVFHFDILSEGIDIDGITGVVLLRSMSHSKCLQTIGRAVRTYKADPTLKKQAWVSVVALNGNDEHSSHLALVVNMIRDGGFEVNTEEVAFTDALGSGIADPEIDDWIDLNGVSRSRLLLNNILHDIEEESFQKSIRAMSHSDALEAF